MCGDKYIISEGCLHVVNYLEIVLTTTVIALSDITYTPCVPCEMCGLLVAII